LQDLLAEHGLEIEHVPPDGNCLFHALVKQLARIGRFSRDTRDLRSSIVDFMRLNESLVVDNTSSPGSTATLSSFRDCEDWSVYLGAMAVHGGKWGDNCVLTSAAIAFNISIHIFNVAFERNPVVIETPESVVQRLSDVKFGFCGPPPIPKLIIFIGHVEEKHYVSTRPISVLLPTQRDSGASLTGWNRQLANDTDFSISKNISTGPSSFESAKRGQGLLLGNTAESFQFAARKGKRRRSLDRHTHIMDSQLQKEPTSAKHYSIFSEFWPLYLIGVPVLMGMLKDLCSSWEVDFCR